MSDPFNNSIIACQSSEDGTSSIFKYKDIKALFSRDKEVFIKFYDGEVRRIYLGRDVDNAMSIVKDISDRLMEIENKYFESTKK